MPIKPDVLMAKFDAILNIGIDCGEGEYRKKIGLYPAQTARI